MSLKLSVVIPTFREVRNLEAVARSVETALRDQRWAYEGIFVDGDSQDGPEARPVKLADSLPVRMYVRLGEKGLSTAVLRGIAEARGEYVVVMDADLSHPAERIPDMLALLENNKKDFVVGSRYVAGGSPDPGRASVRLLKSPRPGARGAPTAEAGCRGGARAFSPPPPSACTSSASRFSPSSCSSAWSAARVSRS